MYYLSKHTYCRELAGGGAVLLDVQRRRYLGIDAAIVPALRMRVANWPVVVAASSDVSAAIDTSIEDLLGQLVTSGTFTTQVTERAPHPPRGPRESMLTSRATSGPSPSFKATFRFVLACLHVAIVTRRSGFASLLEWMNQRQRRLAALASQQQEATRYVLACHLRLRVWLFTAQNHCLFDSLVLANFLTRCGVRCSFVIAIDNKPFMAHAWVQVGDTILNDTVEYAQQFTPLLAVPSD